MAETRRIALISDLEQAPIFADLLRASSRWELGAYATPAPCDTLAGVEWFDDRRVMLTQPGVDAVIIATATRAALDVSALALELNLPVWRQPPLARNFAEATQLVTNIERSNAPYRVASWWEHVRQPVRAALKEHALRPVFSELCVRTPGPLVQSWRAGVVDAGGGVLTLDAYALLEALVAVRDLPDSVSAATGRFRKAPDQPPRETEDVAVAVMRYENGGVAQLSATWDIPPDQQWCRYHDATNTLTLSPVTLEVTDRHGAALHNANLPGAYLAAELDAFAALLDDEAAPASQAATFERHLAVTALLEAVYLSARTWHPESPLKFYDVQGWRPRQRG